MSTGRFPRPYVNDVKVDTEYMRYARDGKFEHLGIGGRPSGLPDRVSEGPRSLEHVGQSASGRDKK